jgi:hypothetical protein
VDRWVLLVEEHLDDCLRYRVDTLADSIDSVVAQLDRVVTK